MSYLVSFPWRISLVRCVICMFLVLFKFTSAFTFLEIISSHLPIFLCAHTLNNALACNCLLWDDLASSASLQTFVLLCRIALKIIQTKLTFRLILQPFKVILLESNFTSCHMVWLYNRIKLYKCIFQLLHKYQLLSVVNIFKVIGLMKLIIGAISQNLFHRLGCPRTPH